MATGLDICGKYLFVADRTFGVDIIDISDIYNPKFISNIPTGETQDVCYSNGYVYAGVWAECKVRICDVRDADNPKEVGVVHLSGRGISPFLKRWVTTVFSSILRIPITLRESRISDI